MRNSYVIVFVSDMVRSLEFYRNVLGLPLRFQSPGGWTEFATEGATLEVSNLDEFHHRMVKHGVRCLQEPKAVFGSRLAQYADPEGLAISVGEAPTRS